MTENEKTAAGGQTEPTVAHLISEDGQSLLCESDPEAHCRMAPDCDSETWDRDGGCHEHQEPVNGFPDPGTGHAVTPGHDCWMVGGHINPAGLDDTYGNFYGEGSPTIHPGKAVHVEFHGTDEGCTWEYEESA